MAQERRSYPGSAARTKLAAGIDAASPSLTLVNASGYPSGSVGPFFLVIGRGTSSEEKIKCATTSGQIVTVAANGRGADGTVAVSHGTDEWVEAAWTADDADASNEHYANVGLDNHTQYMKTDGTRHDVTARHTFGAALGNPGAPTVGVIGDTASAGDGATAARFNHRHGLPGFGNPVGLGVANDPGDNLTLARSNHVHQGGLIKIAEVLTTTDTANLDFSNIPATYRHLKVLIEARSTRAISVSSVLLLVNNVNTGGAYDNQSVVGRATVVSAARGVNENFAYVGEIPGASAPDTSNAGAYEINIFNYGRTAFRKRIVSVGGSDSGDLPTTSHVVASFNQTGVINRLTLIEGGGSNFLGGTMATLYGLV